LVWRGEWKRRDGRETGFWSKDRDSGCWKWAKKKSGPAIGILAWIKKLSGEESGIY
jgi:hypothetical protein